MSKERELLEKLIQNGKDAEKKLAEYDKPFSIGDRFMNPDGDRKCILVGYMDSMVCLVDLETGIPLRKPVKVKCSGGITEDELRQMSGSCCKCHRYWDSVGKIKHEPVPF
jgi:hypothetical protein